MSKGKSANCRGIVVALVCLCLSVILAPSAMAQGNAGRILGNVTDQTGGAIAGATVTVTNVETNVSRTLKTDDAGAYNAPNQLPGMYMVTGEANGFKKIERRNILLEINQDVRVDLQLQPGDVTQTVTVTESVPLVNTTNAEVGGTLQSELIEQLPLNGGNFLKLLDLRPGVAVYPGTPNFGTSTNGLRGHDNVYLFDGVYSSDPWMGQSIANANMSSGDSGTILPIEAIDEFKTEVNPPAEYGWKPGAVVNVGVKSGTNNFHGTGFAYGRDGSWDANNFFNNQAGIPVNPLAFEEYGGTFGGPIKKDKLFFFAAYEDQRYNTANNIQVSVPITGAPGTASTNLVQACQTALDVGAPGSGIPGSLTALSAQLTGIVVGPTAAGHPNGTCVPNTSASAGPLYPGLFPVNPGTSASGPIFIPNGLSSTNQIDSGIIKVDYHLNEKHSLDFTYFMSPGNGLLNDNNAEVNPRWETDQYARAQFFAGNWTFTPNSAWVNEVRVGYSHYYQTYLSPDNQNPADYTFTNGTYHYYSGITNPLYWGFPGLTISGFEGALGARSPKYVGPDGVLSLTDHISYLRGKHTFMFGGEILENQSTTVVTANTAGPIGFDDLPDFFAGFPNGPCNIAGFTAAHPTYPTCPGGGSASLLTGNLARHFTYQGYAGFLQDDWRVRSRLTVNLGLRYEIDTVPKELDNLQGNFLAGTTSGLAQVGAGETSPYNGDHNNFSPRLGIAWDVFGDGKTVLRAGGSLIYEMLTLDVLDNIGNSFGLRVTPTGDALYKNCAGSTIPGSANSSCQVASPGNIAVANYSFGSTPVANNYAPGDIPYQWANNSPSNPLYSTVAACGDGTGALPTGFVPQPCNAIAVNQNLRTPYVSNWTLDLQRQISNGLSLDIGYVGNHGTKLLGVIDENQPLSTTANVAGVGPVTFGPAWTAASLATCAATVNLTKPTCKVSEGAVQAARPYFSQYPYLATIDYYSNIQDSNYNGLQAVLTARNYHGLTLTTGYTYSRALGEASDQGPAVALGSIFSPVNSYGNLHAQLYGPTNFDVTHRVTISGVYQLPGKKGFGQALEGWSLEFTTMIQSGMPWGVVDTTTDFAGTGEFNVRNVAGNEGSQWDFFGNTHDFQANDNFYNATAPAPGRSPLSPNGVPFYAGATNPTCLKYAQQGGPLQVASLKNLGCYALGGSVLIPPAYGGYGTSSQRLFRDQGFRNFDLSLSKAFTFKERYTAQFRAEFFNIFNMTNFQNPYGLVGSAPNLNPSTAGVSGTGFGYVTATPDVAASNPGLGGGGPRNIQLGLKLTF